MSCLEMAPDQSTDKDASLEPPHKKVKSEATNEVPTKVNKTEQNGENSALVHYNSQTPVERPNQNSLKVEDDGGRTNSDTNYFSCYADLSIHRVMIGDHTRTQTYRRAILSNYKLFHRKVVLDVGAGTGILSLFCAQAGAKKVYAIEASAIAEQAQKVVDSNGFSDRIVVMQEKVEDVILPEKVDIIVSEWMGYMLMYESMLPSLLFARDRWLKKDGLLFPETVRIFIAPISDYHEYDYNVEFWNRVSDTYRVDMSALAKTAAEQMQESVHVMSVDPASVQSHASCVTEMRLSSVNINVTDCTQGSFRCSCFGHTTIHGFVIWFTVHFPNNIALSTSPYESETHWEQSVLYIPPFRVQQNTVISGHLWIRRDLVYHRFLDIELEYAVDKAEKKKMRYKMKD